LIRHKKIQRENANNKDGNKTASFSFFDVKQQQLSGYIDHMNKIAISKTANKENLFSAL
jgi:hypothetical protein